MQIVLPLKVRLMRQAHKVIDKGNGHDERNLPLAIVVDDLGQLLPFNTRELFLKISRDMSQDSAMLRRSGLEAQGLHQELLVLSIKYNDRLGSPLGHQPYHAAMVPGAV